MTYVITEPCIDLKDMSCIAECPVDCIYEGMRMLYIHPDECVDCGACEPVCPVDAIYYEDDVPGPWQDYVTANIDFFESLGSPSGASKLGPLLLDAPIVSTRAPGRFPVPEYSGILREFSGIVPPAPGNVALLFPANGIEPSLVETLLLFYDRILVIHAPRNVSVFMGSRTTELQESGLIDIADTDGWIAEISESLLNTLRSLPDLDQSLMETLLPHSQDHNMRYVMARINSIISRADIHESFKGIKAPARGLARLLLPQLVQFAAQKRGLQIEAVTSDQSFAAAIDRIATPIGSSHAVIWNLEAVTPDLSAVATNELLAFRAAHGHYFRRHLDLLKRCMRELENLPSGMDAENWALRRDEIAESAYQLRKITRLLPSKRGGIWSLGAIGDLSNLDRPFQEPSIGRRALAASGISVTASEPEIFVYVFMATSPAGI